MRTNPLSFQSKEGSAVFAFEHKVIPRPTEFVWNRSESETPIHGIYEGLVKDNERNDLIAKELEQALSERRLPLVLTSRKEPLSSLAERLRLLCPHIVVLKEWYSRKTSKWPRPSGYTADQVSKIFLILKKEQHKG